MSKLVEELLFQIKTTKIAEPVLELKFHDTRKWRFDLSWPDIKFACEVEGGTWIQGRHSRGAGMEKDMEKYEAAMLLGWTVYRVSGGMIKQGKAVETISAMIGALEAKRG